MSPVTSMIEVEVATPTQTDPEPLRTEATKPARNGIAEHWPFVAMVVSLCLFAAVFATIVLHPAIKTVTQSAGHTPEYVGP